MSEQDVQTAHAAMAQLNEAIAAFERESSHRPTASSKAASQETSNPPDSPEGLDPRLIGAFSVKLSGAQGDSAAGMVLVLDVPGQGRIPVFQSDELDIQGKPLLMGAITLSANEIPHFAGRLDLVGGGYIVVQGGLARARELMECLNGNYGPSDKNHKPTGPSHDSDSPSQQTYRAASEADACVDHRVAQLDGLAGPGSRFEISIEPGQVSISSCVADCQERGYHSCALGISEVEGLIEVITALTDYPNPEVVRMPPELDDIAITRLNPGEEPPVVILDWRSNWNRTDDGDAAERAWRCVTLHLTGSQEDPSSQTGIFLRILAAATTYSKLWEEGDVNEEQVTASMRNL